MIILRATQPKDAEAERELRLWLRANLGETDAEELVAWVWESHRNGVTYVDALAAIVRETGTRGKEFAYNLLEHARKPKEVREAEAELISWSKPRIEAAANKVRGHRGDPAVAREEFVNLCEELQEKLFKMFPLKHRATMKGAMQTGFQHTGGSFTLNVALLVKVLFMEDPLAATAAMSR